MSERIDSTIDGKNDRIKSRLLQGLASIILGEMIAKARKPLQSTIFGKDSVFGRGSEF